MEGKYLSRDDAPIGSEIWSVLDSTMVEAAKSVLTGRRLLHIEGPYGLGLKGVPLQDVQIEGDLIASPFIPVFLMQKTFTLSKRDLAAFEREGIPVNTAEVANAAIDLAQKEDKLVFNGAAGAPGLMSASGSGEFNLSSWDEMGKAAEEIIGAVTMLDKAGFHGPYSLALSPARYNLLLRVYHHSGITELEHLRTIVTEGIFKAPVLDSGGVLLASGKQYAAIVVGQDMSIGFIGPAEGDCLEFVVSESLVPVVRAPQAICVLKG